LLSKCESCGRENLHRQIIEVGERRLWICPRCYVQIKKNQVQKVSATSQEDSVSAERFDKITDWVEQHEERHRKLNDKIADADKLIVRHLGENIQRINQNTSKNKAQHDDMKKEIERLSGEVQHLKSRIEALENKLSEKQSS